MILKQMLRGIRVKTKQELEERIYQYFMERSDYVYDLFKDEINFGYIVQAEI